MKIQEIVSLLQKQGWGTANFDNIEATIQGILKEYKTQELKINVVREVSGSNTGSLEALRLSVYEAFTNYDKKRKIAQAILEIEGMQEVIIDELESLGFTVYS